MAKVCLAHDRLTAWGPFAASRVRFAGRPRPPALDPATGPAPCQVPCTCVSSEPLPQRRPQPIIHPSCPGEFGWAIGAQGARAARRGCGLGGGAELRCRTVPTARQVFIVLVPNRREAG